MEKIALFLCGCAVLFAGTVKAGDGAALFEGQRCGVCHKLDTGKTYPTLKEIAGVYQAKEEQLINYFNGEAEPIINPAKSATMKRYIEKTKAFSDEDRKALAKYILAQGAN